MMIFEVLGSHATLGEILSFWAYLCVIETHKNVYVLYAHNPYVIV